MPLNLILEREIRDIIDYASIFDLRSCLFDSLLSNSLGFTNGLLIMGEEEK